jgi:branched-chain amino acid transport system permease protein
LITLITNIVILSLLAISFDLCWGFSGIMTFGQALFFGVPGYLIALVGRDLGLSHIWLTLPLAMLTGLLLAFIVALFLLVGRRPTPIFIALGTLTGSYAAERLVSGWQYVGAGNGLSAVKLLQMGSYEFVEGTEFYTLACLVLLAVYLGCRARPCARRHAPERGAARFPWLSRSDLQGAAVLARRHDLRRRRCAL